ncbi:hypothetical protein ACO0LB_17870 [Undibacterium sp. SXout7W]|uniref:hypothetical protein n=1 Tax=Undibacterium sp. SXout7W TaxID=3413049 RepID=UPI003BF276B1
MLNELQPDLRELLDLVRSAENFDATVAACLQSGKPIAVGDDAQGERRRKGLRIEQLRSKWNI